MTMWKWSKTAADNATADSTSTWPEGMAASGVNDSQRGAMAALAKYRDDVCGTLLTSTGSSNAFAATTNQTITALTDGFKVSFVANHTNTGAATLAVDGLAAKPLRVKTGTATPAGAIVSGSIYTASYEAGNEEWLMHGFFGDQTDEVGVMKMYAGASAPVGWLLCNGAAISRTTYSALFDLVGTTYGAGDGSTTFNVPDMGGRVPAGKEASASRLTSAVSGVNGAALGSAGGAQSVTLDSTQIPSHTHTATVTDPGHVHSYTIYPSGIGASDGGNSVKTVASTSDNTGSAVTGISVSNSNTGGGGAHNNVQPTMILNFIIKY